MKHYYLANDFTGEVLGFTREYDLLKYAKDHISLHPDRARGYAGCRTYHITTLDDPFVRRCVLPSTL